MAVTVTCDICTKVINLTDPTIQFEVDYGIDQHTGARARSDIHICCWCLNRQTIKTSEEYSSLVRRLKGLTKQT